jgi:hypothetical protein
VGSSQVEDNNHSKKEEYGRVPPRFYRISPRTGAKGQDLVEFAIVLPFLFLVLFGVLDLGRLFFSGITITNAARTGARYAARNRNKLVSDVIAAARSEATSTSIDLASSPINVTCPDTASSWPCAGGETVRVTITYDFDLIFGGIINLPSLQLIRSYEMMVQ